MAGYIRLPEELLQRASLAADAEGTSLDDFAAKAIQRELARMFMTQIDRQTRVRQQKVSDEEVEEIVSTAIQQVRQSSRRR